MKLSNIFKDNMVLQRNKTIKVWGSSRRGECITVRIGDITKEVIAEGEQWSVDFPPMKAMKLCKFQISTDDLTYELKNVAIGDVWVAGGQSNMEMTFLHNHDFDKFKMPSNNMVRMYEVPKAPIEGVDIEKEYQEQGQWRTVVDADKKYFSIIGYYFAELMNKSLDVPIGIISCNFGGSPVEAWLSEEILNSSEEGRRVWKRYTEEICELDMEEYRKKMKRRTRILKNPIVKLIIKRFIKRYMDGKFDVEKARAKTRDMIPEPQKDIGPWHPWRPCGLYGSMLKNIIGYSCAGVVWYQGESNSYNASDYGMLLTQLIESWRKAWHDELPFLIVQLAPFEFDNNGNAKHYEIVREMQEKVSNVMDGVYLISQMDLGDRHNIHPKNKKPIGIRLANMALNKIYHFDISCEHPSIEDISSENDIYTLWFKNVADGLYIKDETLNDLDCYYGESEVDFSLVEVSGNKVVIKVVSRIDKVELAYKPYARINLFGGNDCPCLPFTYTVD